MTTTAALIYLRRYQRWQRGEGPRDFEAAGLTVKEKDEALSTVLDALPVAEKALASSQAQLAKCRVQRERFHAALRRDSRSQSQESRGAEEKTSS